MFKSRSVFVQQQLCIHFSEEKSATPPNLMPC